MYRDYDIFNKDMAISLFKMAGFEVKNVMTFRNQYRPDIYPDDWFLIQTQYGVILIGCRKRVIHIEWLFTSFRGIVTDDEVSKEMEWVHAWGFLKAQEYLVTLYEKMKEEASNV